MTNSQEIIDQAVLLPLDQQLEIVDTLIGHLELDGFHPSVEQEWIEEIRRRVADVRSGRVTCRPWEEVRNEIAQRLDQVRNA